MRKIIVLLFKMIDPTFWIFKVSRWPFFLRGLIIWILAIGVAFRSFVQPSLSPALEIFAKISCAITGLIMLLLGLELMMKGSNEYIKRKLS